MPRRGSDVASALRLAQAGWRVHGGVRTEADAAALREQGVEPVALDVTDAGQIAAAVEAVGPELDGLVDNAGIAIAAPLEIVPLDELRRQLEVNVVGQVAVLQAFLPALRRTKGRVVLMGSIGGRSALPFLGPYAASKHALEAFADVLRVELRPWGIAVSIVEPASVRTAIWTKGAAQADVMRERALPEADGLYADEDRAVQGGRAEARPGNRPRRRRQGGRARAHRVTAEGSLCRREGRAHPRLDRAASDAPARPCAGEGADRGTLGVVDAAAEPVVAEAAHLVHHRKERAALLRQRIFDAWR